MGSLPHESPLCNPVRGVSTGMALERLVASLTVVPVVAVCLRPNGVVGHLAITHLQNVSTFQLVCMSDGSKEIFTQLREAPN